MIYTEPPRASFPVPPITDTLPPTSVPLPPINVTAPPTPSSWLLEPALTPTSPPVSASPLPTPIKIEPLLPFDASDVQIPTVPESPPLEVPVDNSSDPLVRLAPDDAVPTITSPLVTLTPLPLAMYTLPPTEVVAEPPVTDTSPPVDTP
ncbi:hypothetical protein ATCC90586_008450 [Pythium insidiosum]|nr:hypothetical protein ATCC90586_008450 [Pythium insidiosum]